MPRPNLGDLPLIDAPAGDIALNDNQPAPEPLLVPHTVLRLVPLSMLRQTLNRQQIADLAGLHLSAVGPMENAKPPTPPRHIYGLYCADGLKLYQIKMVKNAPCDIPRDRPITIAF